MVGRLLSVEPLTVTGNWTRKRTVLAYGTSEVVVQNSFVHERVTVARCQEMQHQEVAHERARRVVQVLLVLVRTLVFVVVVGWVGQPPLASEAAVRANSLENAAIAMR